MIARKVLSLRVVLAARAIQISSGLRQNAIPLYPINLAEFLIFRDPGCLLW
jgi:hypothetical protein